MRHRQSRREQGRRGQPDAGSHAAGSTKTDAPTTGDQAGLFNNTATPSANGAAFQFDDWDQSMKTGSVVKTNTPVMAATTGGRPPRGRSLGQHAVRPIRVDAPGVNFVNHTTQNDADEAVKAPRPRWHAGLGPLIAVSRQATTHTIKNGETFPHRRHLLPATPSTTS